MDRRTLLKAAPWAGASFVGAWAAGPRAARAAASDVDPHTILDDPDAPAGGNPDGDVAIVPFVDYNCPFCKRSEPELRRFVAADGKIRVVYKDWPILARSSVTGARLALAAQRQGKYEAAHAALMAVHGKATDSAMREAVATAGVDMERLDKDLAANDAAILGLIRRNAEQAQALGLRGTRVYLIGPYIVADALNYDGVAEVVSKFRSQIGH